MRRMGLIVLFAALWLGGVTGVAAADDALETYLEAAEDSSYSGNELVVTIAGDETVGDIYAVSYARGTMTVGDSESMVGSGKAMATDGSTSAEIAHWSEARPVDRYTLGSVTAVTRLGRDAEMVEILEAGVMRARITFDAITSAPLTTEVFDGAGKLFRLATLLTFDEVTTPAGRSRQVEAAEYDVLMPAGDIDLPRTAGGYVRADAYIGPDEAVHAFYSDGLFSFSVFVVGDEMGIPDEATVVKLNGSTYRRIVAPTDIWLFWEAADATHVLVGDLPPDHLDAVLGDLPAPESRNLFGRLWHRLFG